MKIRFFKRITAFVVASLMAFGVITVLPEEYLPKLYITTEAVNNYRRFSVQCGENSTMTLSDGILSIDGLGNMYDIALDNQLSGYSTYYDYRQNSAIYINEINIYSGITSIGSFAFSGFSNLSYIFIPDTIESINSYAFSECTSLSSITIPKDTELNIYDDTIFSGANQNLIIYGHKGSSAEKYALKYNINFFALNDGDDIINSGTCGDNAFWQFDNKGVLTISGTGNMKNYSSESPWFNVRKNIISIVIEEGITSIGDRAFTWSENLKNVTIPESVISIGVQAFMECHSLENVIISNNVKFIYCEAFFDCRRLKSVTILNKDVFIDDMCFQSGDLLTIYGYNGSTAEAFVNENNARNLTFVALDNVTDFTSATMTQFTNPINVDDKLLFNVVICDSNGNPINISDLPTEPTYTVSVSDTKCIRIDDKYTDLTGAFIQATAIGEGTATVTIIFSNGVSATSTVKVGKSETGDDNTDTSSDSRYEKLHLIFEPKNISYTIMQIQKVLTLIQLTVR